MNKSFDKFIYNLKNQHVVENLLHFIQGLGPETLILSGPEGSGKTHLIQAAATFLGNIHPENTIFYGDFKDWNQELLDNSKFLRYVLLDNATAQFAAFFRRKIPDYAQGIYHRDISGIRYVLALRSGEDPVTPLEENFLHLRLAAPDLDIRIQYIRREAALRKICIANEDILDLALQYKNIHNFSIDSYKSKTKPNIFLTPEKIILLVADFFQLKPEEIKGKKREKKIIFARQTAMFLCRKLLKANLKFIGNCFQNKNHASILYSINKLNMLYKNDQKTHNLITELRNLAENSVFQENSASTSL